MIFFLQSNIMYFHPWKYFANSWWWNLAKKFYPPAVNQITNCARVKAILILVKAENYEISINCMHEWKFACICHINFSISLENIAIIDLNFVKKIYQILVIASQKGLKILFGPFGPFLRKFRNLCSKCMQIFIHECMQCMEIP